MHRFSVGLLLLVSHFSSFAFGMGSSVFATEDLPKYSCRVDVLFKNNDATVCSGSLISADKIITAKHCVAGSGMVDRIIVGCPHSRIKNVEEIIDAKVLAVHPKLDLMLIQLDKEIPNPIVSIALPDQVNALIKNDKCYSFGYGQTNFRSDDGGENHRGLKADFKKSFSSVFDLLAGGSQMLGLKPILRPGDSGGALVCLDQSNNDYLVAVHHSGSAVRSYSTYLRVAIDWIVQNLNRK